MIIKGEKEFREFQTQLEVLIQRGTVLGDMGLLSEEEKDQYSYLSEAIHEWEAIHYPLPGRVSTVVTDAIKKKMDDENLKQKDVANMLGVSESRISDILKGRRPLNLNIVKRLRDKFGIPADFILDHLA